MTVCKHCCGVKISRCYHTSTNLKTFGVQNSTSLLYLPIPSSQKLENPYKKGLCITMQGYVGLCRAVYGYVELCRAMYGYVGLCMAMQGYVGLCMAKQGYVGLCRAMYG